MADHESDGLWAGILGALVFLVFLLVFNLGAVVSLLVGLGAWGAGFFLFSRRKPAVAAQQSDWKDALAEGQKRLGEIQRIGKSLKKPSMVSQVDEIAGIVQRILAEVESDPQVLKQARQFLTYYLDSTIKILNLYLDLVSQDLRDETIQKSLSRAEGLLGTLRDAFEKQLARLLSNDVMNLDTEISLLEQTIKMEGLGK